MTTSVIGSMIAAFCCARRRVIPPLLTAHFVSLLAVHAQRSCLQADQTGYEEQEKRDKGGGAVVRPRATESATEVTGKSYSDSLIPCFALQTCPISLTAGPMHLTPAKGL